jgi:multiple sugar transport system substrate-binding protein
MMNGCKQADEKNITIKFWAMGVEGEAVSKLIPEFEKQNPGIKIKVLQIAWVAAHEKLITAYASETLPDVFQLGNTWIPEFESLKAIEPLNNYIAQSKIISKNKYFKGIWDTNVMDSVAYGIPWYVDTRVLFYRKDILENVGYKSPPHTWEELYDVSKKIKKKLNDKNKYAFFIPTNEWFPFIVFGMQNGSELLKNNDRYGDFSGEKFKEAMNYLAKFYYEELSPVDMQQLMNIYQGFEEGFYSLYITGPWNVAEFQKRLPANMQNEWMTAPLPSPTSNYPGYSLPGGSSLVINSLSENKKAAWKWIEFLSKKETQLEFHKMVSSLPSVVEAWNDPSFANNIYMKAFYEQLQKTKPTPKIPEWEQIVFQKIQQYAELIARKKMSVDEAMEKLDDDVNNILEKRRWLLSQKK